MAPGGRAIASPAAPAGKLKNFNRPGWPVWNGGDHVRIGRDPLAVNRTAAGSTKWLQPPQRRNKN